jgi:ABC-type transport system substrate-binding protein
MLVSVQKLIVLFQKKSSSIMINLLSKGFVSDAKAASRSNSLILSIWVPKFDALYEKAFLETDDTKRFELYQQMDQIIIEEAPIIPLFYDKVARFTRKNVEGLGINPLNLLSLKKVKKK